MSVIVHENNSANKNVISLPSHTNNNLIKNIIENPNNTNIQVTNSKYTTTIQYDIANNIESKTLSDNVLTITNKADNTTTGSTTTGSTTTGSTTTGSTTSPIPFILEFKISLDDIKTNKNIIKLPFDPAAKLTIKWEPTVTNNSTTHTYKTAGTYQVEITGTATLFGDNKWKGVDKLIRVKQFGSLGIIDYSSAFDGAVNLLTVPNDSKFSTNVRYMADMFAGAKNFNSDISAWNVSNVVDMSGMFNGASKFNSNLNSWNVEKVVYMSNMFYDAKKFNSDLSKWNISNVIDMTEIFRNTGLSVSNGDKMLIAWSKLTVKPGIILVIPHSLSTQVKNAIRSLKSKKWSIK